MGRAGREEYYGKSGEGRILWEERGGKNTMGRAGREEHIPDHRPESRGEHPGISVLPSGQSTGENIHFALIHHR